LDFRKTFIYNFYFIFTMFKKYLLIWLFSIRSTIHIISYTFQELTYWCIRWVISDTVVSVHDQRLVIPQVLTSISNRPKSRDKLCYLQVLWYIVLLRLATSLMPLQPATTSRTCLENCNHDYLKKRYNSMHNVKFI